MKLFNLFKKIDSLTKTVPQTKVNIHPKADLDLAEKIFEYRTYQPYVKDCDDKEIKQICWDCQNIQESLNKAIEYCGEPNNPRAKYLYAKIYAYSRKEYRQKAIFHLEDYLSGEPWIGAYEHRCRNISDSLDQRKKDHIYDMIYYLAVAYEKEYLFDNAMINYEKMISLCPEMPFGYSGKVSILIKTNKIDDAINFLKKCKKSKYYRDNTRIIPNDLFMKSIDELLDDCALKKQNEYKYRPRKK